MNSEHSFAIGAVSRLLGLSTHTLRKWEDRYGAVHPTRSQGGDRRYSRGDVDRLARLKSLVDLGHSISTIAMLTDSDLDERLGRQASRPDQRANTLRAAILGSRLWQQISEGRDRPQRLEFVKHANSAEELANVAADALIVEMPSISTETRTQLRRIRDVTGVDALLVIYRFGSLEVADTLSDPRTVVLSGPVGNREIERVLLAITTHVSPGGATLGLPPHRFSRDELAEIAMMSPALACECPRHVAKLIIELSDFEQYSEDCEISKPDDAVIHAMLRRTAATSRSIFEDALVDLAAYEGISLGKQ